MHILEYASNILAKMIIHSPTFFLGTILSHLHHQPYVPARKLTQARERSHTTTERNLFKHLSPHALGWNKFSTIIN